MPRIPSWLLITVGVFILNCSCRDNGIDEDHSNIADPFVRWRAYNFKNYSLTQTLLCYCVDGGMPVRVTVRGNHIVNVVEMATGNALPQSHCGFFKTGDELFEIARRVNPDSVAQFIVEYDKRYGLPTTLYIDFDEGVVDEEVGYQSQFISRD